MRERLKALIAFLWKEHSFGYEYNLTSDNSIEVEVTDGDWKHDHIALTKVMRDNGFKVFMRNMHESEKSFDDSYSCTYIFVMQ